MGEKYKKKGEKKYKIIINMRHSDFFVHIYVLYIKREHFLLVQKFFFSIVYEFVFL